MLAVMERENPTPLPGTLSAQSDSRICTEQWQALAEQQEDEDVYLCELTGVSQLDQITTLQAVINTSQSTVSHLGAKLPNLEELNLSHSVIDSLRDLGSGFRQLQVLWVSRCGLTSLDGLSAMDTLRELYAAYNDISDLQPVAACTLLEVLDLEGNCIADLDTLDYLVPCTALQSLNINGNPVMTSASHSTAAAAVRLVLPALEYLNDQPLAAAHTVADGAAIGAAAAVSDSHALEEGVPAAEVCDSPGCSGSQPWTQRSVTLDLTLLSEPAGAQELELVAEGIKHARVGVDSHEFHEVEGSMLMASAAGSMPWVLQPPDTAQQAHSDDNQLPQAWSAPQAASGSAGSSSTQEWTSQQAVGDGGTTPPSVAGSMPHAVLPPGASLMPVTASAWLRTLRSSSAGALAGLRMSREGSLQSATPPGGEASNPSSSITSPAVSRPPSSGTPPTRDSASSGPTQRPPSASPLLAHSLSMTSTRPSTAASGIPRPFSARPGTASFVTATNSQSGSTVAPGKGGLYWTKHRLQAPAAAAEAWAAPPSHGDSVEDSADAVARPSSVLTLGGDAIGGSLAKDLRRRRKGGSIISQLPATAPAGVGGGSGQGGQRWVTGSGSQRAGVGHCQGPTLYDSAQLLEELRRWKLEAADRALLPEESAAAGVAQWAGCDNNTNSDTATDAQPQSCGGPVDILDLSQERGSDPDVSQSQMPLATQPSTALPQTGVGASDGVSGALQPRASGVLPRQVSVGAAGRQDSGGQWVSRAELVAGILEEQVSPGSGVDAAALAAVPLNDPRIKWLSQRSVLSKVMRDVGNSAGASKAAAPAAPAKTTAWRAGGSQGAGAVQRAVSGRVAGSGVGSGVRRGDTAHDRQAVEARGLKTRPSQAAAKSAHTGSTHAAGIALATGSTSVDVVAHKTAGDGYSVSSVGGEVDLTLVNPRPRCTTATNAQ